MKIKMIITVGALCAAANCLASTYPLTLTDMDGQTLTLTKEPAHVILQDGRDILSLALLDRENPFRRVVAWNNLPKKQDVETWQSLKKTWPAAGDIIDMGFNDQGQVNLESVIAQKPDLMIAQLRAKPALEQTGVISNLQQLGIPVLFIDYELHPAQNTAASITLLGKALNQEARAAEYTAFYQQRFAHIQQTINNIEIKPTVFIEPIAGNSDNCCFTHGHNGWGGLVESVGAHNIGSDLLPGASGFVSLEKIIAMKPDAYIMTGSKRSNNNILPFGYGVSHEQVGAVFNRLIHRTGLDAIAPVKAGAVFGVYHHFYNHPYNIIGMEILAKDLYPQALPSLDPLAYYHHIITTFTHIPDAPITLSYQP
ncbi:ABC transporter substrate-binding protein [Candidatus Sodalis endolongispinus]